MAKRRKKNVDIEKLHVRDKHKKVNGSVGGDICIFIFLTLLGVFMVKNLIKNLPKEFIIKVLHKICLLEAN